LLPKDEYLLEDKRAYGAPTFWTDIELKNMIPKIRLWLADRMPGYSTLDRANRKHRELVSNWINSRLNPIVEKFFPNFVKKGEKSKVMRKISGAYSFVERDPPEVEITWLKQRYGHNDEATTLSYNTVKIVGTTKELPDPVLKEKITQLEFEQDQMRKQLAEMQKLLASFSISSGSVIDDIEPTRELMDDNGKHFQFPVTKFARKASNAQKIDTLVKFIVKLAAKNVKTNENIKRAVKAVGFGKNISGNLVKEAIAKSRIVK
jgi:hypothetical protein